MLNKKLLEVSSAGNSNANLTIAGLKAPKNGYAYIYVSNESDEPVYFDNLRVSHNRGRIVEEDHYYAFGLKIAGISSRKLADVHEGNVDNKYLYNDKELFDDGDLNWEDYGFRNYDVQLGRFVQIDPLTDETPALSGYHYALNDPITNIDEDGLSGINSILQQVACAGGRVGVSGLSSFLMATSIAVNAAKIAANALDNVVGSDAIGDQVQGNGPGKNQGKAPRKDIRMSLAEQTVSFLVTLDKALDDAKESVKRAYNTMMLNIELENGRTGTTLGERVLRDALRFENWGLPEELLFKRLLGRTERVVTKAVGSIERKVAEEELLETVKKRTRNIVQKGSANSVTNAAKEGTTVIGEGMARVEAAASKIPGAKILNDMPKFTGTADQITSQMMQYNRKWILNEMRSGRTILDIGRDATRANSSIFYQMEQNMLRNYQKLHPGSLNIIKP